MTLFFTINPCRPSARHVFAVFLSGYNCVCQSLQNHHEGRGGYGSLIFLQNDRDLLRGFANLSRRNPSSYSRNASSPKVEKYTFPFFFFMFDAQEAAFWSKSPLETYKYIPLQRITSSAETEKYWHLGCHRHRLTSRQTSPIPPLRLKILQE